MPTADAAVVRFAYETYAGGDYSLHQVRHLLADRGFRALNGKPIPLSGIERLLKNPFYAGRVQWASVEYPGNHEAVVSEVLFRQVQRVLARRHKDPGEKGRLHFPLRGIARCAECGGRLTAERHDRWTYYRCVRRIDDPARCSARLCSGGLAETAVESLLRRLRLDRDLKTAIEAGVEDVLKHRREGSVRQTRSLRMRRTRLEEREVRLSETFADGGVSAKAYRVALTRLRSQLAAVATELDTGGPTPDLLRSRAKSTLEAAASLASLYGGFDARRRKRLLQIVFREILLDHTGLAGYRLNPPFDRLLHDGGDGASRPPLEDAQVRAAIDTIFEVNTTTALLG